MPFLLLGLGALAILLLSNSTTREGPTVPPSPEDSPRAPPLTPGARTPMSNTITPGPTTSGTTSLALGGVLTLVSPARASDFSVSVGPSTAGSPLQRSPRMSLLAGGIDFLGSSPGLSTVVASWRDGYGAQQEVAFGVLVAPPASPPSGFIDPSFIV